MVREEEIVMRNNKCFNLCGGFDWNKEVIILFIIFFKMKFLEFKKCVKVFEIFGNIGFLVII